MKTQAKRKGFTLVELLAVIAIIVVVATIGMVGISAWVNYSRFVNSESGAKTIYQAAQNAVTYYRSSGELETWISALSRTGKHEHVTIDGVDHTIIAFNNTDELREFLAPFIYDPNLMTACICVEFDEASQSIYSVFYSTQADAFTYDESSASGGRNGTVSLNNRDLSDRRQLGLGYYSSLDIANVKSPNMKKLKLTTLRLNNDERLTLEWSCNAEPGQVEFEITFYGDNESGAKATVLASWLGQEGQNWVDLQVSAAGAVSTKRMYFSCIGGVYTLVLDSMASAGLIEAREAAAQDSIVGIHELMDIGVVAGAVNNIYATVKVRPTGVFVDEYLASGELASNKANPLYGDSSSTTELSITKFRHLYNIRYRPDDEGTACAYTLGIRHLSWERIPVVVNTTGGSNPYSYSECFPSIPLLPANCTLDGKSGLSYEISRLKLGSTSVCEDDDYLGLFIELQGEVSNLRLSTAELSGGTRDYTGVGVVCGLLNGGSLNTVTVTGANNLRVNASILGGTLINTEEQPAGLGGIVGVAIGAGSIEFCNMNGAVEGTLHYQDAGRISTTVFLPVGVGGIVGYSSTDIKDCINNAHITGNSRTGGIVGTLQGEQIQNPDPEQQQENINTVSCINSVNYGVISCSVNTSFNVPEQSRSYGHCFGGIIGYCEKSNIVNCENASGLGNELTDYMNEFKGKYVGGIVGLSSSGYMSSCSTREGSFVTGASRVGGIVGGFEDALLFDTESELVVAQNASSVIGIEYVGGIIGENPVDNIISGCVNTGTVLAKQKYAGGIAGYNEGLITSCASYVYDYGNRLYNTLLSFADATAEDRFRADYVGGLAGYNSGSITFDTDLNRLPQKDLASIVIGGDYVGGLVGYNNVDGIVSVHYDIIGGKIDGEHFVGAFIGYNVSEDVGSPHELDSITVSHFGVNGISFVGGAIGAYIKTNGDSGQGSMLKYHSDNRISVVSGVSCVGGLVGYVQVVDDMSDAELYNLSLELISLADEREYIEYNDSVFRRGITIIGENRSAVEAGLYGGGIVGYCEPKSKLTIEDSSNSGNVSRGTQNVGGILITQYSGSNGLLTNEKGYFLGGIIGVNDVNCVIDDCTNTGVVSADSVIGGICGLNLGLVQNCRARVSIGTARSSYAGGIVGINLSTYEDSFSGSSLSSGISCRGRKYVGGVCGMNLGVLEGFSGSASCSVSVSSDCAGSVTGYNSGTVIMDTSMGIVNISADRYAGGLVGDNKGVLNYSGNRADVVTGGSINAGEYAGGLIGRNSGSIECENGMNTRASVSTRRGYAGGVVGLQETGPIENCHNYGEVATAQGYAGGITSLCGPDAVISNCTNHASVSNNYSGGNNEGQRAGGIVAINNGIIQYCSLINDNSTALEISGKRYLGGICAENNKTIENCVIQATNGSIIISGTGTHIGAACGINQAEASITSFGTSGTVSLQCASGSFECIGGAVGQNLGTITGDRGDSSTVTMDISFADGKYVGGIVGDNQNSIIGCKFVGTIRDTGASGGARCIGGIVGRNGDPKEKAHTASVENCIVNLRVSGGNTTVLGSVGVYTASVSDHHGDKAGSATLIGGIAGANYDGASLIRVFTEADDGAFITAKYGLIGGITGYNNGIISCAGGPEAEQLFFDGTAVKVQRDISVLEQQSSVIFEQLAQSTITLNVLLQAGGDGLVGGVTGLNGQYGSISCVSTGRWLLENRTSNPDSPIGGIIGLNETELQLNNLINFADVLRKDSSKKGYASGGMIGRQECRTMMGWIISRSINYGTITDEDAAPRNGGVIGIMKYNGGTLNECINHGMIKGAGTKIGGGGMIGRMFWFNSGTTMNIVSCVNYGNAVAGIIEMAQPHNTGDSLKLNIVDCINYGKCTSGIFHNIVTSNVTDTTIKRCRNYGECSNGIMGAAATSRSRIVITDCFSINDKARNITSLALSAISGLSANNYYMNSTSCSVEDSLKPMDELNEQGGPPPEEPESATFGLYRILHKNEDYTDTLYATGESTGNQMNPALMFNGSTAEGDRWSFRRAAANNNANNIVIVEVDLKDDHNEFHAQNIAMFKVYWFSTSNRTPSCNVYYKATEAGAWVHLGTMGGMQISKDTWSDLTLDQAVSAVALRFEFNSTHRYISAYELQIIDTSNNRIDVFRNPPESTTPSTPESGEYNTAGRVIAEQLFNGTYADDGILAEGSATHVYSVTEEIYVDYFGYSADPLGQVTNDTINAGYNNIENTLFFLRGEEIKAVGDSEQTVGNIILRYPAGTGIEDISDKYVLDYYERLDSRSPYAAPTNLLLESQGMSNTVNFVDSNANTKLYELNIYIFDSAENAQSFRSSFNPEAAYNYYTPGNTTGLLATLLNREAYTTSFEFQTENEWESKYCVVSARCCGQSSKSDYAVSNYIKLLTIIEEPKVRFEMVKRQDNAYRYLASVENADDYVGDWKVSIKTTGTPYVVNEATPNVVVDPYNDTITASWQAWVYEDGQAVAASVLVSAQTNIPGLGGDHMTKISSAQNAAFHGTSFDDLSCTVQLSRDSDGRAPVYRVELIRKVGENETVVSYGDFTLSAKAGTPITATLTNLPEYLFDGIAEGTAELYLRCFISSSGMGPVYYYHDMDTPTELDESDNVLFTATSTIHTKDMAEGEYSYLYSVAMDNELTGYYKTNIGIASPVMLPTPVISPEVSTAVSATTINHTFNWDIGVTGATYNVELYGLLYEQGTEQPPTEILLSQSYGIIANTITLDGSDWGYEHVRLRVARVGSEQGGVTVSMGRSQSRDFDLPRRLTRIGVPTVTLANNNDIQYEIAWMSLTDETELESYEVYLRYPVDNVQNFVSIATLNRDTIITNEGALASGVSQVRRVLVDLEQYAEQTVSLFIVARPTTEAEAAGCVYSPEGESFELEVLQRMQNNIVSITSIWQPQLLSASFMGGGLSFELKSTTRLSGNYVAAALLYETTPEAVTAENWQSSAYQEAFNLDNPVSLGYSRESVEDGVTYYIYEGSFTSIGDEHAGKPLVIMARATSPLSISSVWSFSEAEYLPMVQLDAPRLGEISVLRTITGEIFDNSAYQDGETIDTEAEFNSITWQGVDYAAGYQLEMDFLTDATTQEHKYQRMELELIAGEHEGVAYDAKLTVIYGSYVEDVWVEDTAVPHDEHYLSFGEENSVSVDFGLAMRMQGYGFVGTVGNRYFRYDVQAQLTINRTETGDLDFAITLPDPTTNLNGIVFVFTKRLSCRALSYNDAVYPPSEVASIND